jgi:2-dehydro-3-deoxyphosphogluconate aldolase/(4S)-4-hydroxy-2-oxoglutarate aldolase
MNFDPNILEALRNAKVIPVVTVDDTDQAFGIAGALLAGGLNVIEITLRTEAAIASIRALKERYPDLCVGAGTVLNGDALAGAVSVGADFVVTPGVTPSLLDALASSFISAIPGAQTSSEVMTLSEAGFDVVKFFPAETCGGVDAIKAMAGPLQGVQFVPTGGIGPSLVRGYLDLPNVMAVGGSWVASSKLITEEDWGQIKRNAESIGEL